MIMASKRGWIGISRGPAVSPGTPVSEPLPPALASAGTGGDDWRSCPGGAAVVPSVISTSNPSQSRFRQRQTLRPDPCLFARGAPNGKTVLPVQARQSGCRTALPQLPVAVGSRKRVCPEGEAISTYSLISCADWPDLWPSRPDL